MKKCIYFGLKCPESNPETVFFHCPIIRTFPLERTNQDIFESVLNFHRYTHLIFTSKSSVAILVEHLSHYGIPRTSFQFKKCIAVGRATAEKVQKSGFPLMCTAEEETAEGIIKEMERLPLTGREFFFWPHSTLSRRVIPDYLLEKKIVFHECALYGTTLKKPDPLPDIDLFDELFFTSPSTIDAFLEIWKEIPSNKKLTCQGPVTQAYLLKRIDSLLF